MGIKPSALVIVGTRPEAIKLASVVRSLRLGRAIQPIVCATGQHRALLDTALGSFQLRPNIDLNLMQPGQAPQDFLSLALARLGEVVAQLRPEVVIVQGDTSSAFAGALAGFYAGVPVAHVEAGLRTDDLTAPFPEEGHRQLIARIASLHFAPTENARRALMREGVPRSQVVVTGNSGIDALKSVDDGLRRSPLLRARLRRRFAFLDENRPLVLCTIHRRENVGSPLARIAAALRMITHKSDAEILLPLHPNPVVADALRTELHGSDNIHLADPLDYTECLWLLRRARLVLTDSGGLQEEAATLGVPLLVLRETTERPEGVAAGLATLVGADPVRIAGTALAVLRDPLVHQWMARAMPLYGTGDAGRQIAQALAERFCLARPRARQRAAA